MENVVYVPESSSNLVSVSRALDHDSKFKMWKAKFELIKPKGDVGATYIDYCLKFW